jgi:hypothetical protein
MKTGSKVFFLLNKKNFKMHFQPVLLTLAAVYLASCAPLKVAHDSSSTLVALERRMRRGGHARTQKAYRSDRHAARRRKADSNISRINARNAGYFRDAGEETAGLSEKEQRDKDWEYARKKFRGGPSDDRQRQNCVAYLQNSSQHFFVN